MAKQLGAEPRCRGDREAADGSAGTGPDVPGLVGAFEAEPLPSEGGPDRGHRLDAHVAEHHVLVPRQVEVLVADLVRAAGQHAPVLGVEVSQWNVARTHRPSRTTSGKD